MAAGVVHADSPAVKRQRVGAETPSGHEVHEERSTLPQQQTSHCDIVHDNGGMPPHGALDHLTT